MGPAVSAAGRLGRRGVQRVDEGCGHGMPVPAGCRMPAGSTVQGALAGGLRDAGTHRRSP